MKGITEQKSYYTNLVILYTNSVFRAQYEEKLIWFGYFKDF